MKITLIRHGKTKGNLQHEYIGITDEPLCQIGIEEIKKLCTANIYPEVKLLFSSPLKRCIQTASIIYSCEPIIFDKLSECDFGEFEGKTYEQLKEDKDYIKWLQSGGKLDFPRGEGTGAFIDRTNAAFEDIIDYAKQKKAAEFSIVCHGGTIMAILGKYSAVNSDFYDWQAKNGNGYSFIFDTALMQAKEIKPLF